MIELDTHEARCVRRPRYEFRCPIPIWPTSSTRPAPPASRKESRSRTARSRNFLLSMRKCPGISQDDVVLAVTTLAFDIAGLELFHYH